MKNTRLLLVAALVAAPGVAHADLNELKWATEGYFRTRTVYLTNLAPQDRQEFGYLGGETVVYPDIRNTSYITSRLRVMPTLSYAKLAKLIVQVDALDDVLWGDNNGLSSAPLFATDSTNQYFLGGPQQPSVEIPRAWVEFQVPVGAMRVGRMASHWGMGLLANGGGTGHVDPTTPVGEPKRRAMDHFMADDFGDKHFGSTADRILFATKPLSIYKTITKAGDITSNLIVGYAFDKLSESPFLPLEPFERNFRPFGQQGFISRGASDDVNEHVGLVLYNNADWDQVRYTDELRVGVYGVLRSAGQGSTNPSAIDPSATCGQFEGQPVPCVDTGSKVWILDLWWRLRYGPWYTEGEGYMIGGKTFGGVPAPPNTKKKANITAGVARVGYFDPTDTWDVIFEVGHASGDDDLFDEEFKQRAIHPDYNVGLILYEDILREQTARAYFRFFSPESPNGATGFFSNGGVINSNYIYPRGHFRTPIRNIVATGALLLAWVDELAVQAPFNATSKFLGAEIDAGLKASFAGNMEFSLETGYLFYGDFLKQILPNADGSFSLQTRLAFIW